MNRTPIPRKQLEKTIAKSAKKVIAESSISPSRSGSKDLGHLVKRLANQPFSSLETASQLGEELGQKIVAFSQTIGKQNLDRGVIRQIVLQKQFLTVIGSFSAVPQPNAFQQPFTEVTTPPNHSTQVPQDALVRSEVAEDEVENQIEDETQTEAQSTSTVSDADRGSEKIEDETVSLESIPEAIENDDDVYDNLEVDRPEDEDVEKQDSIDGDLEVDSLKDENLDIEDEIDDSDQNAKIEDQAIEDGIEDEDKDDEDISSLIELQDEEKPLASTAE